MYQRLRGGIGGMKIVIHLYAYFE